MQLGRLDEAAAGLAHILEKKPDSAWVYDQMARLAARRGREVEALAAADHFASLQSGKAAIDAYRLKATLLSRFGHQAEAAQAWSKALSEIDREIAATAVGDDFRRTLDRQRLDLLIESGQVEQAIATTTAELRRAPNDALTLNARCWARASHNQALDKALADCDAARRLQPLNSTIAESRGFLRLRLGKNEEAIADYDAALDRSQKAPTALYGRGIALLRKGDKVRGERDLAAARLLDLDIDAQFKDLGVTP